MSIRRALAALHLGHLAEAGRITVARRSAKLVGDHSGRSDRRLDRSRRRRRRIGERNIIGRPMGRQRRGKGGAGDGADAGECKGGAGEQSQSHDLSRKKPCHISRRFRRFRDAGRAEVRPFPRVGSAPRTRRADWRRRAAPRPPAAPAHRSVAERHSPGKLAVEQPGGLELVESGQVADRIEAEMDQELCRCPVSDRPAGRLAPATHSHPAGLHQHVEGALRHRHAPDLLDVGARNGLVVGDDRQRFDGGARQFALVFVLAGQQPRQVRGRAKRPAPGDSDQIDAAAGVETLQLLHDRSDIGALG